MNFLQHRTFGFHKPCNLSKKRWRSKDAGNEWIASASLNHTSVGDLCTRQKYVKEVATTFLARLRFLPPTTRSSSLFPIIGTPLLNHLQSLHFHRNMWLLTPLKWLYFNTLMLSMTSIIQRSDNSVIIAFSWKNMTLKLHCTLRFSMTSIILAAHLQSYRIIF